MKLYCVYPGTEAQLGMSGILVDVTSTIFLWNLLEKAVILKEEIDAYKVGQ